MCNYWAAFIKTGNPNCSDADGTPQEEWKPWSEASPERMTFYDTPKSENCPADSVMEFFVEREKA